MALYDTAGGGIGDVAIRVAGKEELKIMRFRFTIFLLVGKPCALCGDMGLGEGKNLPIRQSAAIWQPITLLEIEGKSDRKAAHIKARKQQVAHSIPDRMARQSLCRKPHNKPA